jgi:hypothetical protein
MRTRLPILTSCFDGASIRVSRLLLLALLVAIGFCEPCRAQNAHINFETPSGYLLGFRDYLNNVPSGNSIVPYVGNYRISDDASGNGIFGSVVIVDPATGQLTVLTDFDDLHTFSIGFDRASMSQIPYSGAIDVINVAWFGDDQTNEEQERTLASWQSAAALRISDWQATGIDGETRPRLNDAWAAEPNPPPPVAPEFVGKKQNGIGLIYGVRMFEREDSQAMYASGGILGTVTSETVADNHIMGPAAGLVWIKTRGRWTARLQGLVSVGFNAGSVEQTNQVGAELVPGATNRLLYAQPTESAHHDSFDEFSPSGELRAEANYRITENVTFAINWSGVAIENALEAENRRRDYLPDFGLNDPGNQRLLVHNFFCGIEMLR